MKKILFLLALVTLTTQAFAKKTVVCEDDLSQTRLEWSKKNKEVMSGYFLGEANTIEAKATVSEVENQKVFLGKLVNAEGSVDLQLTLTDDEMLEVKSLDPNDPLVWFVLCK